MACWQAVRLSPQDVLAPPASLGCLPETPGGFLRRSRSERAWVWERVHLGAPPCTLSFLERPQLPETLTWGEQSGK